MRLAMVTGQSHPRTLRLGLLTAVGLAVAATGCEPNSGAGDGDGSGDDDDGVEWPAPNDPPEAGSSPQYRLEAAHVGIAPEGTRVGGSLELMWKSEPLAVGDYSASKSSPSIEGDSVYIGVDSGILYALDVESGDVKWSFKTHKHEQEADREDTKFRGIHGTAAVDDTQVYIGDYAGYLYALTKEDGELVWETKLGGSIGASPALYGGYSFMAVEYPTPDGKVFVQDVVDGTILYETPFLGNHPHSSASVDPERGYLFVGANNGKFFCFDFVNETDVWEYEMDDKLDSDGNPTGKGDIKSTAAVVGDVVYITSWDHKLHAVDIETGERVWAFESDGKSMSSPSYYDGVVYFGSHDGRLYAIDETDGSEIWSFANDRAIISSPTVIPDTNTVAIGSNSGMAYILDLETGDEVWSQMTDGTLSSVPVAAGDSLYLNDASGTVWRFVVPEQ